LTPTITIRDGYVCWRGIAKTPDEASRLLAVFRQSAKAGDWWSPYARDHAEALEAAMREAGYLQHEREAA
jgi:hypothetical protein